MKSDARTAPEAGKQGQESKPKPKCTYCPWGHSILWYGAMPVLCPYCHAKLSPGETACRDFSFSFVSW